jgi:hypothetical protein
MAVAWRWSGFLMEGATERQILSGDPARRAFHLSIADDDLVCRLSPNEPTYDVAYPKPPFLMFFEESPVHVEWCKYGPLVCEPWWITANYAGFYLSIIEIYELP